MRHEGVDAVRIAAFVVAICLLAPIGVMIISSLSLDPYQAALPTVLTTRHYVAFATSAQWRRAASNTAVLALTSATLATVLGTPFGIVLPRISRSAQRFLIGLVALPLLLPAMVGAVSLYRFAASVPSVSGRFFLMAAHAALGLPLVIATVYPSARRIDEQLILTAASLGAGPGRILVSTILPLVWPAVAAGWLLACASSVDELIFAIFLTDASSETLPVKMWRGMRFDLDPAVTVVGSLIAVGSAILFWSAYAFTTIGRARK